ncbi:hypothetical protein QUB19_26485 [Microcoleus sp. B4-C5]|uniref:hypothetical protein n=1 Tax=unclassified Microcoleus TaxID=2642155 RepID=UPI002FD61F41
MPVPKKVIENGAISQLHPLHPSSESVAELPYPFFLTSVIHAGRYYHVRGQGNLRG